MTKPKVLVIIPARGGSKEIKNKNIFSLNGPPLLTYTIQAAKKSRQLDDFIISTESEGIVKIAKVNGGNFHF